jgi:hypothetical protein
MQQTPTFAWFLPTGIVRDAVNTLLATRKGLILVLTFSAMHKAWLLCAASTLAVNHDGLTYIAAAQAFESGNYELAMKIYPVPFYPALIALVHTFGFTWINSGRLISSFSFVLVLVPLYFLAEDMFDNSTAFWSCLAFSLAPEPVRLCLQLLRDPPFALFFTVSVYLSQHALRSKKTWFLLGAAVCSSAMLLFRLEGMLLFPVVMAALAVLAARERGPCRTCRVFFCIWFVVSASVVTIAVALGGLYGQNTQYLEYLQDMTGPKWLENYHRIQSQLNDMELFSPYGIASQNFAEFARQNIIVVYLVGILEGLVEITTPLSMVALIYGLRRSCFTAAHYMVMASAVAYLAMIFGFTLYKDFFDSRFLLVPAVLLTPWIGWGLRRFIGWNSLKSKPAVQALAILVIILLPLLKSNHLLKIPDDVRVRAGVWLSGHPELTSGRVLSTDDLILFYACDQGFCIENQKGCREFFTTNFDCLKTMALQQGINLIITYEVYGKVLDHINGFTKIKEIKGKKKSVVFYLEVGAAPAWIQAQSELDIP